MSDALVLSMVFPAVYSVPDKPPEPVVDAANAIGQPVGNRGQREEDEADDNQHAALAPCRRLEDQTGYGNQEHDCRGDPQQRA